MIHSELLGYRSRGRGYLEIERQAEKLRSQLGFSSIDSLEFRQLIEGKTVLKSIHPSGIGAIRIDIEVASLPHHIEGFTQYDAENCRIFVGLSENTYFGLESGDPWARFTIGHELGHCFLHPSELLQLKEIPHLSPGSLMRGKACHEVYEDTEWQADAFASALLIPFRGIAALEQEYRVVNERMLQECFGVSGATARKRVAWYQNHKIKLTHGLGLR